MSRDRHLADGRAHVDGARAPIAGLGPYPAIGCVEVWIGVAGGVGVTSAVAGELRAGDVAVDLDRGHAALAGRLQLDSGGPSLGMLLAFQPGAIDDLALLAVARDVPGRIGARAIVAPPQPEVADAIGPDLVAALLASASAMHRRVLVDAGSRIDASIDAALTRATTVVIVARSTDQDRARAAEIVALLRRGAVRARIELDLRHPRSGASIPAGRAAFELGVAPRDQDVDGGRRAGRGRWRRGLGAFGAGSAVGERSR